MARLKVEIAGTDALFAELTARLGFKPQLYRGNVFNGRSTERLVDLFQVNLRTMESDRAGL